MFSRLFARADGRIRTGDLILTKDALYLLSYISAVAFRRTQVLLYCMTAKKAIPILKKIKTLQIWLLRFTLQDIQGFVSNYTGHPRAPPATTPRMPDFQILLRICAKIIHT